MGRYGYNGPDEYEPLSPWSYFGHSILYSIPVLGIIVLIIQSIGAQNVNLRSYARSFWCGYVILAILVVAMAAMGVSIPDMAKL